MARQERGTHHVVRFPCGGGGPGGEVTVSQGRAAIERVRRHDEVGWVHGERAGHHTDALGR